MTNGHHKDTPSIAALDPLLLVQCGQRQAEAMLDLQKKQLDMCDEAGRDWGRAP